MFIGHLIQGRLLRNFQSTCGPCSPMCTQRVNYEYTKTELEVNLNLTKNELKVS